MGRAIYLIKEKGLQVGNDGMPARVGAPLYNFR